MEGWVDLGDLIAPRSGVEPTTAWSKVRRCTTKTPISAYYSQRWWVGHGSIPKNFATDVLFGSRVSRREMLAWMMILVKATHSVIPAPVLRGDLRCQWRENIREMSEPLWLRQLTAMYHWRLWMHSGFHHHSLIDARTTRMHVTTHRLMINLILCPSINDVYN